MELFIIQPMFQLLALLVTALSSYFLIRSVVGLSPSDVAKMSGAHLDANPKIGNSFAIQKADTVVGFALLMASVLFQMYMIAQPLRWADTAGLSFVQTVATLTVFGVIYVLAERVRKYFIKKYREELEQGLGRGK